MRTLRLLSIVEALTVTGPLKPLLMFSSLARRGAVEGFSLEHRMLTTRRVGAAANAAGNLEAAAEAAGIDFVAVPERTVADPRVLAAASRHIREFGPTVIETHDSKSHFILSLVRLFCRDISHIPWVAFHHGYTRTSWRVRVYQSLDFLTLRHAAHVNTLCKPFASDLVRRGVAPSRITVLTNTVEPGRAFSSEERRDARTRLGIADDAFLLLTVGRLSGEKGHELLVRAASTAARQSPAPLRLVIAGDGPERGRLEALAQDSGAIVTFLGQVDDAWPLYQAADAFVLPSRSEGSPLVIFEAMAARLPIIATRVGGVPEVLADRQTALLLDVGDVTGMAERIVELASDIELRRSLGRSCERELRKYAPERYTDKLAEIYSEVVACGRAIAEPRT